MFSVSKLVQSQVILCINKNNNNVRKSAQLLKYSSHFQSVDSHHRAPFFDCTVSLWYSKYRSTLHEDTHSFVATKTFWRFTLKLWKQFSSSISVHSLFHWSYFNFGAWFSNFVVEFEHLKIETVSFFVFFFMLIPQNVKMDTVLAAQRHVMLNWSGEAHTLCRKRS